MKADNTRQPEHPLVKITGVDTVGKSTLAGAFTGAGYRIHHSPYHPRMPELADHYRALLRRCRASRDRWILDRGFVTEHVYGPVLRGRSRLSRNAFDRITDLFGEAGGLVIYLYEDEALLRERLRASVERYPRHQLVLDNLPDLLRRYDAVIVRLSHRVPLVSARASARPPGELPLAVAAAIGQLEPPQRSTGGDR